MIGTIVPGQPGLDDNIIPPRHSPVKHLPILPWRRVISFSTPGGCKPQQPAQSLPIKDIRRPEHIGQLAIEGLPAEFPPLKTLETLPLEWARLPRPVGDCPYRGLAAFREADAPFYCRREAFVDLLEQAVRRQVLTAVIVGSSGSGKSSALFAGLLPRLLRRADHPSSARQTSASKTRTWSQRPSTVKPYSWSRSTASVWLTIECARPGFLLRWSPLAKSFNGSSQSSLRPDTHWRPLLTLR